MGGGDGKRGARGEVMVKEVEGGGDGERGGRRR